MEPQTYVAAYFATIIVTWTMFSTYARIKSKKRTWDEFEIYFAPFMLALIWPISLVIAVVFFFVKFASGILEKALVK